MEPLCCWCQPHFHPRLDPTSRLREHSEGRCPTLQWLGALDTDPNLGGGVCSCFQPSAALEHLVRINLRPSAPIPESQVKVKIATEQ